MESVIHCQDALLCSISGSVVSIQMARLKEQCFQEHISIFLDQASKEWIRRFAAKAQKAGLSLREPRATPNLYLRMQMLMILLEAHGSKVSAPKHCKRPRDNVCWTYAYQSYGGVVWDCIKFR
ncbi:hypothetical protein BDV40DRAFT_252782, partial [Aspergillus tamarii]